MLETSLSQRALTVLFEREVEKFSHLTKIPQAHTVAYPKKHNCEQIVNIMI